MQPEEIAERIWPGRELVLEPLAGGLTNQNFKLAVDGDVCVLRIGGKDSELLAIDRSVEHGASLVAAELGIGPEVVGYVEPEGYLVTRFIEGRPIPPEEMREPETVARRPRSCAACTTGPRSREASTRFASSRRMPRLQLRAASRSPRSSSGRAACRYASRRPEVGPFPVTVPQRLPEPQLPRR